MRRLYIISLMLLCMSVLGIAQAGLFWRKDKPQHTALDTYLQQLGYKSFALRRDSDSNDLLGDAVVQGKKYTFLLDTGFSYTTAGKALAKKVKTLDELGLELEDPMLGRLTNAEFRLVQRMELGSLVFSNQPVLVENLNVGEYRSKFGMVIGADFLLRHHCLLDCLDGKLYLSARDDASVQAQLEGTLRSAGYHEVKVETGKDVVLSCEVRMDGHAFPMFVDMGANYTSLDDDSAASADLYVTPTRMLAGGVGDIGIHSVMSATVSNFMVGDCKYEKRLIAVQRLEHWGLGEASNPNRRIVGLLGADFLGENQALLDFHHLKMWIRPPEKVPAKKQAKE